MKGRAAYKYEVFEKAIGGIYCWKGILHLFLLPVISFLNRKEHLSTYSILILKMHRYAVYPPPFAVGCWKWFTDIFRWKSVTIWLYCLYIKPTLLSVLSSIQHPSLCEPQLSEKIGEQLVRQKSSMKKISKQEIKSLKLISILPKIFHHNTSLYLAALNREAHCTGW